jgi:hypothetical protein
MYEKKVLEKWLKQIKSGELIPDAIGLGTNRDKAIEKIRNELNQFSYDKPIYTLKKK